MASLFTPIESPVVCPRGRPYQSRHQFPVLILIDVLDFYRRVPFHLRIIDSVSLGERSNRYKSAGESINDFDEETPACDFRYYCLVSNGRTFPHFFFDR